MHQKVESQTEEEIIEEARGVFEKGSRLSKTCLNVPLPKWLDKRMLRKS